MRRLCLTGRVGRLWLELYWVGCPLIQGNCLECFHTITITLVNTMNIIPSMATFNASHPVSVDQLLRSSSRIKLILLIGLCRKPRGPSRAKTSSGEVEGGRGLHLHHLLLCRRRYHRARVRTCRPSRNQILNPRRRASPGPHPSPRAVGSRTRGALSCRSIKSRPMTS